MYTEPWVPSQHHIKQCWWCTPTIQPLRGDAGRPEVPADPPPRSEFKDSLGYIETLFQTKKKLDGQAREITQRLRALAILAEDQSLIPSTHNSGSQHLYLQLQGIQHPLFLQGHPHACYTQRHTLTKTNL